MLTLSPIGQEQLTAHNFLPEKTALSQTVGRFEVTNTEGAQCGTVHAIRLVPYTILWALLKIPFLSSILTKILYGDYTYATMHQNDFYISRQSLTSTYLQQKVITHLNNAPTELISQAKIERLRAHFLSNKEPFRKLAHNQSKMYRGEIPIGEEKLDFALTIINQSPEVLAQSEFIDSGGFKNVHKIVNITKQKEEALLLFKPRFGAALSARREMKIYSSLREQGVENILGMETLQDDMEGKLVGIMPYCPDGTFAGTLRRVLTAISREQKLKILTTIAQTIAKLHVEGVVHRDIRPENIVMEKGCPKLIDFGISASIGEINGVAGVPGINIPPEHVGKIINIVFVAPSQDAYAFGMMVGKCLTIENEVPEIKNLYTALTHPDPALRMTMDEAYTKLVSYQGNSTMKIFKP